MRVLLNPVLPTQKKPRTKVYADIQQAGPVLCTETGLWNKIQKLSRIFLSPKLMWGPVGGDDYLWVQKDHTDLKYLHSKFLNILNVNLHRCIL